MVEEEKRGAAFSVGFCIHSQVQADALSVGRVVVNAPPPAQMLKLDVHTSVANGKQARSSQGDDEVLRGSRRPGERGSRK